MTFVHESLHMILISMTTLHFEKSIVPRFNKFQMPVGELHLSLCIKQLQLIPEISSLGSGNCDTIDTPSTCEMDHLRFYCVVRRLVAVENSVLNALQASIYELYNQGNPTPIPARHCSWINSKVPELKPRLESIFC